MEMTRARSGMLKSAGFRVARMRRTMYSATRLWTKMLEALSWSDLVSSGSRIRVAVGALTDMRRRISSSSLPFG